MTRPEFAPSGGPLIYVVDDAASLTRLYEALLEGTGCVVRAFNDRAEALAALEADGNKPALLITDHKGHSMPVERFMHQCLAVHPALRILMASGLSETDVRFCQVRPHRFIRKPFTPEEFRQEIRAALAPVDSSHGPQSPLRRSPPISGAISPRHFPKKRNLF